MAKPLDDAKTLATFPLTGIQLIESSAGTGKTYTIANLYVRQLLAGRRVREILVVTFTKAATEELRDRIRTRLFQALDRLERGHPDKDPLLDDHSDPDRTLRQLRFAVRAMDEAAIFTIHGFCQRILREQAFQSGYPFGLSLLSEDREYRHQALMDWWRTRIYPLTEAQATRFREVFPDFQRFQTLLSPLLNPQPKRLLPDTDRGIAEVFAAWDRLSDGIRHMAARWSREAERYKAILRDSPKLSRAKKSAYHPHNLETRFQRLDAWAASDPSSLPADFPILTRSHLMKWMRRSGSDPDLDAPFFQECEALWKQHEGIQRDLRIAALKDAAAFVTARVRAVKAREQVCAYDDLVTGLQEALSGPQGAELCAQVRARFPVAMIDEFQDTDPVQYDIFARLYRDQADCALVMIGDPKQAIYGFRGSDIFAYMAAKRDVGSAGIYTLDTNWRSTPEVIKAINALFQTRPDPFVFGEEIPFFPAEPPKEREQKTPYRYLHRGGQRQPALRLWFLEETNKERAAQRIYQAVAWEIARLLEEGYGGRAMLGDTRFAAKDIAVLVRTHEAGKQIRQHLARLGIRAISRGGERIFASAEAEALTPLLRAILSPRDPEQARRALASPLLGQPLRAIEDRLQDEEAWSAWLDHLMHLHERWQRRGFMAMFQTMLRVLGIPEALGREPLAERRLTNLLHLGELLQQAAKVHVGMDDLVNWYRRRCQDPASGAQEMELRLESDEDLVQILTIHGSKGLQYPVVFLPDLWWTRENRKATPPVAFHDQGPVLCLDLGSPALETHHRRADRERLAEDLRLAYVGLTRAQSALYLVCVDKGMRENTALGYLLGVPGDARTRSLAPTPSPDFRETLDAVADRAQGQIQVTPLPEGKPNAPPLQEAVPDLRRRRFRGTIRREWRVSSFSALTREVHQGGVVPRNEAAEDVAFQFPMGSQVGSYLHLLLERLDFQGPIREQVAAHSARIASRFQLDHDRWGAAAGILLERVIQTPLDAGRFRLAHLAGRHRLSELAFDFSTGPVLEDALNALLQNAAGRPLPPLRLDRFQGMISGVIDLVFFHNDRYYLADYKSNFLGDRLADYSPDRLEDAIFARRYDLQYLLYSLALHRYLGQRVRGYTDARHFGGVYYLFLRGMRPETGPRFGVYFQRPPSEILQALDREVFSR